MSKKYSKACKLHVVGDYYSSELGVRAIATKPIKGVGDVRIVEGLDNGDD